MGNSAADGKSKTKRIKKVWCLRVGSYLTSWFGLPLGLQRYTTHTGELCNCAILLAVEMTTCDESIEAQKVDHRPWLHPNGRRSHCRNEEVLELDERYGTQVYIQLNLQNILGSSMLWPVWDLRRVLNFYQPKSSFVLISSRPQTWPPKLQLSRPHDSQHGRAHRVPKRPETELRHQHGPDGCEMLACIFLCARENWL